MKKLFLTFALATGLIASASASDFLVDGIDYSVYSREDQTVYVTWSSTSYKGDIVIPSTIVANDTTWTVTCIGAFAFMQEAGVTSVKLPSTIKELGTAAFGYATGLTSVEMPSSVRSIGNGCFNGASALKSIQLPDRLDFLGNGAFAYTAITTARVPAGLTVLPSQTFEECRQLISVEIPEGITEIGFQAFQNNFSLTSIKFPSTLETIGFNCFAFVGLESLHFPAKVKFYGDNAFTNMSALKEFTVDPANEWFTSVDGVLYSKDLKTICYYPLGCGEETYQINAATDSIGSFAFYGSTLKGVTMPANLRVIGKSAFGACNGLSTVVVPDKVETIMDYGFFGCGALKELTLGSSVQTIGSTTFGNTISLKTITSRNPEPPTTPSFTAGTYADGTLNVPAGSVELYSKASGWSDFKTIRAMGASVREVVENNPKIRLSGHTVIIEATSEIPVVIYSLDGKSVFSGYGSANVSVDGGQVYVVMAGTEIQKIFVR